MIDDLNNLPDLFGYDNTRDDDHLVVGFLNFQDFSKGYKDVSSTEKSSKHEYFYKFKKLLQDHFEGLIFGEFHWKKDVLRKIEELIIPDNLSQQALTRSEDDPDQPRVIRVRNIFYMKARNTIDEYLSRMVYRAD